VPRIRAASIEEHKTLTRHDILEAAAALFRAQGYNETSLGDIASHVGIGRTTLYEYFADKEAILIALVQQELPGLMEELVAGLPEAATSRERLRELVTRGLAFVSDESKLGAMLMKELPNISKEAQHQVRRAHFGLADAVVRVCEEGTASGEFRDVDPGIAGQMVYGLMMAASQGLMRSPQARQHHEAMTETMLTIVFDGLAAG
jgi:AcrR family transcriptional regulator